MVECTPSDVVGKEKSGPHPYILTQTLLVAATSSMDEKQSDPRFYCKLIGNLRNQTSLDPVHCLPRATSYARPLNGLFVTFDIPKKHWLRDPEPLEDFGLGVGAVFELDPELRPVAWPKLPDGTVSAALILSPSYMMSVALAVPLEDPRLEYAKGVDVQLRLGERLHDLSNRTKALKLRDEFLNLLNAPNARKRKT
jgi:hypothetical protein